MFSLYSSIFFPLSFSTSFFFIFEISSSRSLLLNYVQGFVCLSVCIYVLQLIMSRNKLNWIRMCKLNNGFPCSRKWAHNVQKVQTLEMGKYALKRVRKLLCGWLSTTSNSNNNNSLIAQKVYWIETELNIRIIWATIPWANCAISSLKWHLIGMDCIWIAYWEFEWQRIVSQAYVRDYQYYRAEKES